MTTSGVRELALSMLGQGNVAWAERLLREKLALTPYDVQTMRILALVLQAQDRTDDAIATLRAAIACGGPEPAQTHVDLGALFRTLNRPEHAVGELRRALAIDASISKAWRLLGDALADLGEYAESAQAFARARSTDRFGKELDEADSRFARGEGPAAEEIFRGILKREAGHAGAICGLAAVAIAAGRLRPAERLLNQALRQSPHMPQAWRGLARLYAAQGRPDAAEDALERLRKFERPER